MSKSYAEKLKDPRWQKKRLEIFERDSWKCQACGATEIMLCVHHRYYNKNAEPWEYHNDALVTLCELCHETETKEMQTVLGHTLNALKSVFLSSELVSLMHGLACAEFHHPPQDIAGAISWALFDEEVQGELVERYLKSLEKKKFKVKK